MHKHIDKCECGAKDFKRIITVSHSKTADIDDETRQANDMIGHSWR